MEAGLGAEIHFLLKIVVRVKGVCGSHTDYKFQIKLS